MINQDILNRYFSSINFKSKNALFQTILQTSVVSETSEKVCRQLQQLMTKSVGIADERIQVLIKRRDYYLKKLVQLQQPAIAACSAIGLSILLSASTKAQECRTFHLANESNPLQNNLLPYDLNLASPFIVDIDNDGDLDCYESYPDAKGKIQLLLLRNNGTKVLPYFRVDTADGFDVENEINFSSHVSRQQFVDIDSDGDYDCFIGQYNGAPSIMFYKNTGSNKVPQFVKQPQSENPLAIAGGKYVLYFRLIDFDGDGDYDLTTSDLYSYRYGSQNYLNVGTATNPVFEKTDKYKKFYPEIPYINFNSKGLNFYNSEIFYQKYINLERDSSSDPVKTLPKFPPDFYPYQIADLNNDGFYEAFDEGGNYATLSPVPVVDSSTVIINNIKVVRLDAFPKNATLSYRWRRNGEDVFQNNRDFIIARRPGLYTVEITGNCGTGVSLPYKLTKSLQSNISNEVNNLFTADNKPLSVTTYPNPFAQEVSLYLGTAYPPNTIIKVTDMQGKILVNKKATGSTMHLGKELQRGIYIVQVLQNNIVVHSQKVIKQ